MRLFCDEELGARILARGLGIDEADFDIGVLNAMLAALPEDEEVAVRLSLGVGLSSALYFNEIAPLLGVTPMTVSNKFRRGVGRMAKMDRAALKPVPARYSVKADEKLRALLADSNDRAARELAGMVESAAWAELNA